MTKALPVSEILVKMRLPVRRMMETLRGLRYRTPPNRPSPIASEKMYAKACWFSSRISSLKWCLHVQGIKGKKTMIHLELTWRQSKNRKQRRPLVF